MSWLADMAIISAAVLALWGIRHIRWFGETRDRWLP